MWHDINERNLRYVSPRLKSLGTPTLGLNLVELRGMNGYAPAWLVARPKAARDRAFARAILERPMVAGQNIGGARREFSIKRRSRRLIFFLHRFVGIGVCKIF